MESDLATVQAGFAFPEQRLELHRAAIDAYLAAVGETDPLYGGEEAIVPPVAIMALSMRGLAGLLAARPGTLHMSQRIQARRSVPVGSVVTATLTVKNRSERRGFAVLNLAVAVLRAGETVQEGAILLMVPLQPAGSARHA